jgi:hypothetical protein
MVPRFHTIYVASTAPIRRFVLPVAGEGVDEIVYDNLAGLLSGDMKADAFHN